MKRSRSQSPQQNRSQSQSRSPPQNRRPLSPNYNTPDFVNERKQIGAAVSDALDRGWVDGLSEIVAEMTLPHFTPDPLCGCFCSCDIHDGYHIDCCVDGEPQWDRRGNCLGCGLNILNHN